MTSDRGSRMEYEAECFSQCSADEGNESDLHGMLALLERCSWTCGNAGEVKLSQERVQAFLNIGGQLYKRKFGCR